MIYIMDASTMLAFLRDEAGADVIETYLLEPGSCRMPRHRFPSTVSTSRW